MRKRRRHGALRGPLGRPSLREELRRHAPLRARFFLREHHLRGRPPVRGRRRLPRARGGLRKRCTVHGVRLPRRTLRGTARRPPRCERTSARRRCDSRYGRKHERVFEHGTAKDLVLVLRFELLRDGRAGLRGVSSSHETLSASSTRRCRPSNDRGPREPWLGDPRGCTWKVWLRPSPRRLLCSFSSSKWRRWWSATWRARRGA